MNPKLLKEFKLGFVNDIDVEVNSPLMLSASF